MHADWMTIALSGVVAWLLAGSVYLALDVGRLWWRHRQRADQVSEARRQDQARRRALARFAAEQRQRQRLRVATRLGDRMDHPD
jgi:hypothetical protein